MDKEYIERKPLINQIRLMPRHSNPALVLYSLVQRLIFDAPTADVVEVKHGKWIWKELYGEVGYMLVCSECEESEGACERYDYCPNCGAKMDLKEGKE